jgi:hypothetical protein
LARWDFLGYPQSYPAIERTGATSAMGTEAITGAGPFKERYHFAQNERTDRGLAQRGELDRIFLSEKPKHDKDH